MSKRGKKDILADILINKFTESLLAMIKKKHLSILAYHSIQPRVEDYPYNTEIISAYPEMFEDQIAFVAKHFNVVNFLDIAQSIDTTKGTSSEPLIDLPPNSLVITFDDGYADNLTTAMPILHQKGLTAVVYLASDFIDQQKLFWFDEVAYFVRNMPSQTVKLCDGAFETQLDSSDRESQRRAFGQFLQGLSDSDRLAALQELREVSGFDVKPSDFHYAAPLTWEQVRMLRQSGIEIGSHTKNHGFLDAMTPKELVEQISRSKTHIESMLGEEIVSFSYPNGNFHSGVVDAVQAAGYSFAVSYDHAIAHPAGGNRFLLPRIHVETDVALPLFKGNLLLPKVFVR